MTNIGLKVWNWCRRFRKRCGYGVHSPYDFYLITFVIYEKLPYYVYTPLKELRNEVKSLSHYREKVDKLLFRLVNHLRPSLLLEIGTGSGLSSCYMASGNQQMDVLTSDQHCNPEVKKILADYSRIKYDEMDLQDMFLEWDKKKDAKVMVHIAHTPNYKEAYEKLLPLADERTCFVIGSPYADKEKKSWWKEVIADSRTGVTFDLYDIGLIFFDKKRIKEHRIVNFL